jgi:hypothetical protein
MFRSAALTAGPFRRSDRSEENMERSLPIYASTATRRRGRGWRRRRRRALGLAAPFALGATVTVVVVLAFGVERALG